MPSLVRLTLVKQISRCVLHPAVGRTNAILGSCSHVIHTPPQPAGLPAREVCVCVCFWGAPWGEAGQSLPEAALGQGMAIQDTCLALGPDFTVAVFVFSPVVHTFHPAIYTDPHFNPSVQNSPFLFCLHTYRCNLFCKLRVYLS